MITRRRTIRLGPTLTIGLPTLYMLVLFIAPIFVFFIYSFWQLRGYNIVQEWTLKNYIEVVTNSAYTIFIIRSIVVGFITAAAAVLPLCPPAGGFTGS